MHEAKLLIILCVARVTLPIDYKDEQNAKNLPRRILQLLFRYKERGTAKIYEMRQITPKYEESPHFETGYVVSEILERYRKIVGNVKRPMLNKVDSLFDTIKATEMVQKYFFELFHLVNMMHEIPKKYSHMAEFQEHPEYYDSKKIQDIIKGYEILKKIRVKEKKIKMKQAKKERAMILKGITIKSTKKPRKPKNKWWPIDYGWEIQDPLLLF